VEPQWDYRATKTNRDFKAKYANFQ
jgi:hypothetical protein